MPRPPRLQVAGGLFHVTTRSPARRPILPNDDARATCLRLVERACARYGWMCHAYCVMTTHYHALITTPEENLSRGMQWLLNGLYASIFNEEYASHGHVFGARFTSVHVVSDAHLLRCVSYLAMNPVAAGMCTRPADWKFSSYPALVGGRPAGFLELKSILRLFAFDRDEAQRRIEEFVRPPDVTA